MQKRVLIISYYWPPSGGAGVQRWLKMVKYMPEYGFIPTVFTPENPQSPATDRSLLKEVPPSVEVIKLPIWEPIELYQKFLGKKSGEKMGAGFLSEEGVSSKKMEFSKWVRGNFFIPDAKRFWIKPAIRYLSKYLKNNRVDCIISTGPPHSMHLIALGLKKKFPDLPWIADFRDPWTSIDFYDELKLSKWADKKQHQLEKQVIQQADEVVCVGKTLAEELAEIKGDSVEVITNGFDAEDFENRAVALRSKFVISHVGSINRARSHEIFWQALRNIMAQNAQFSKDVEVELIGKCDITFKAGIAKYGLEEVVKNTSYLPHNQIIEKLTASQLLYLPINNSLNAKGILTGKLFEYLAAKRPILAIGPVDGDVAHILKETGAGVISGFEDVAGLEQNILGLYNAFRAGTLNHTSSNVEHFSRSVLAKRFCDLIDQKINRV